MKKRAVRTLHAFFRIRFFENILRAIVKGRYIDSFLAKLVPGHHSYPVSTYRLVKDGPLTLHADIHDYNDWKAYWGLKEIEREELYKLARSSRNIIDVGSNNGWVLMNLSALNYANKGMVYGFEPHPQSFDRCMKNIKASGVSNCQVYNLGCGIKDEEKEMTHVSKSNSGQNQILNSVNQKDAADRVKVRITSLDTQLSAIDAIDLIKIDVEGFEMNVLRGATRILEEDRPMLFIEVDDKLLRSNDTTPSTLLSFLKNGYGYEFVHATTGKKVLVTDDFTNCHLDVICIAKKSDAKKATIISSKHKAIEAA
jgi:FkbM family methyltransferase